MRPFGATILDATGHRLSVEEKAFFRDVRPFGFILFARNIDSPDQVRALCDEMREAAGHEAVITIDQEGGRVQRMRAPQWRDWRPFSYKFPIFQRDVDLPSIPESFPSNPGFPGKVDIELPQAHGDGAGRSVSDRLPVDPAFSGQT